MNLASTEHGDGPPLIILHGLFGSGRNWSTIARRLSKSFRVIALDLRNHGESPWTETMSYREMADDVAEYIATRNLRRPIVLGHSMGGKVAMMLALEGEIDVGSLIVVDIAPVAYQGGFGQLVEAMATIDLAAVKKRADADAALAKPVPEAALRAFLLQNLVTRDGSYTWRINLGAITAGLPELSGFPTLEPDAAYFGATRFIAGSRSGYVKTDHHETIGRLFRNSEIAVIDDAGHWPHAEKPTDFMALVEGFLDRPSRS